MRIKRIVFCLNIIPRKSILFTFPHKNLHNSKKKRNFAEDFENIPNF